MIVRLSVVLLLVLNIITICTFIWGREKDGGVEETISEPVDEVKDVLKGDFNLAELNKLDLQVDIIANTDFGKKTLAPISGKVGEELLLFIESALPTDQVYIVGNNDYRVLLDAKVDKLWNFTPERSGIFNVVVITSQGNERATRQIKISGVDRYNYYQLSPLTAVEEDGKVTFSTSIFDMPKNIEENNPIPFMSFTIGEADVWSKKIKIANNSTERIVEGKDFQLDRGNYTISAALRDYYSVADEDVKSVIYERVREGHKVIIDDFQVTENQSGDTFLDHFEVKAHCENTECELVYAFFIKDALGSKRITSSFDGYGEATTMKIAQSDWSYDCIVRVKHKENSDEGDEEETYAYKLPNAYEATETITVERGLKSYDPIQIKSVDIEPTFLEGYYSERMPYENAQTIKANNGIGTVYAHTNNYITVHLADAENMSLYEYSASVTDDGEMISLENVYDETTGNIGNQFVYYPMSGGKEGVAENNEETHNLQIVVVKRDQSGDIAAKSTMSIILEIE